MNIKLYHHKTDGGAEYLFDTFIDCENGHKEGVINDQTKYVVRIDGDITKDAELSVKEKEILKEVPEDIKVCLLECVVMPQGEVISMGKTLGYIKDFENKLLVK